MLCCSIEEQQRMYSKVNEELHRLSADLLRVTHEKEEALCLCEIAERNAAKQQSLAENVRTQLWLVRLSVEPHRQVCIHD
jgi:hypothetical protein